MNNFHRGNMTMKNMKSLPGPIFFSAFAPWKLRPEF
jgi:hypothetical protein